jgi:predicted ATP-dependent serine protease
MTAFTTENDTNTNNSAMDLGFGRRGARKLCDVRIPDEYRERIKTGFEAVDEILSDGGGIVPIVSATLSAKRGSGKTTLLMQIMDNISRQDSSLRCLYSSGEEYVEQLALAAERLHATNVEADNITLLEDYIDEINSGTWSLIVVDSLATVSTNMRYVNNKLVRESEVTEKQWNMAKNVPKKQMEHVCSNVMIKEAKKNKVAIIFIIHQNKDGTEAGAKEIAHSVDACFKIYSPTEREIDKGIYPPGVRVLISDKNRFGGTGSVAFRMTRTGFDLHSPSETVHSGNENNEGNAMAGNQAARTANEIEKILETLGTLGDVSLATLFQNVDMPQDATAIGRHERHVTALVKMGKVVKEGRGQKAVYRLPRTVNKPADENVLEFMNETGCTANKAIAAMTKGGA